MGRNNHASFIIAGTYNKLKYGLNDKMYLEFIYYMESPYRHVLSIKVVSIS